MNTAGPLDLERQRDLGDLLRTTLALYRDNLATVLAVSGAIVVTVDLILGAGLNEITSGYRSNLGRGASLTQFLVSLLVLVPLINATAAVVVLEVSRGRRPDPRGVLQRGLDVFAPTLLVVVLYWAAVFAGLVAFVIPGIFLFVWWYFAIQSVVVEERRGFTALQRSSELVTGGWLRVAGILLVINLGGNLVPALALGAAADALAKAADAQVVALVATMAIQVLSFSFIALATALLFFDLRARRVGRVGTS